MLNLNRLLNLSSKSVLTLFAIGGIVSIIIIATNFPNTYQNINAQSTPTCTAHDTSNLKFLWNHIHDFTVNGQDRLKKLNYCIAVAGKILSQNTDPDGDIHMMVALDKSYAHYSTEKAPRQGEIVVEAICQKPAQYQKAIDACNGVTQDFLKIPSIGTHVFITGSYVIDTEHGWAEIHPVSSIYAHP